MNRHYCLKSDQLLFLLSAFSLAIFSIDARGAYIADIYAEGADNGSTTSSVVRQSAGFNLSTGQGNTGDISLMRNGSPLTQESGAGIVTPNTYRIADGIPGANVNPRQAASYTGRYTSSTGNSFADASWLALGHIVGAGGGESNFPVSLAYFPYSEGWYAGTVLADGMPGVATEAPGSPLMGNFEEVTVTHNSGATPITYTIEIEGHDSTWFNADTNRYNRGSGMLFVTDAANEASPNYTMAAPVEGGWEVSIYDQQTNFPASISGPFNFVYIPFAAPNLIGGIINTDASVIQGVGDFQAFDASPVTGNSGEYFLVFPDGEGGYYDETDGILMLTITNFATNDGGITNGPDDNYLVYQPATTEVEGEMIPGFLVASHDLPNGTDQTTAFSFAFLRYDAPIQFVVPEPSTIALALLASLGLFGWSRRRKA